MPQHDCHENVRPTLVGNGFHRHRHVASAPKKKAKFDSDLSDLRSSDAKNDEKFDGILPRSS